MRHAKRCENVPVGLYLVDCIVRKARGLASAVQKKTLLLPHEFLGALYRRDAERFHRVLGTPQAANDFWWEIRRHNPIWFQEHVHHDAIVADPSTWLPVIIFGDDAKLGKNRALLSVHFYSPIGIESRTEFCKIPSFLRGSVDAIPGVTDANLWECANWSWRLLGENEFPTTGFYTESFSGWRRRMAGKPILGAFRAAIIRLTGDWMWTTDTLNLEQSYKAALGAPICHRCGATNCGAVNNFTDFRPDAPHWSVRRSNAAYMASAAARCSPCSGFPGFHIQAVWPELMHGGPLGYNLTVTGSVLRELGDEAVWVRRAESGTWMEKLQIQLSAATDSFKEWQTANKDTCSQPKFTVRKLSLTRLQQMPTLKAKAHNSMVVLRWLEAETRRVLARHPGNTYFRDRATMVWGLCEVYRICKRAPQWMSEEQLEELKYARAATLTCFVKLSKMAAEDGSTLYPRRPKMHVFDECIQIALETTENPTSSWTFQDEDNMRVMVGIAESCHGLTMESSSLEKWLVQFFADVDTTEFVS